jgi:outer membrane protein TolC
MDIARETRTMADEYYTIVRRRYALGTVTLLDFNNAQFEKDKAVTDYLTNLREYWTLYFLMRKLTLFDFIHKTPLEMTELDFR